MDIQQQIDGLSVSQISDLQTRLNAVDSTLTDLNASVRAVENTLSYVQGVQTLANTSIARLDASTATAFVNIANLTQRVNELSGSTSGDAQHLANIDASINALRARQNLQDASITQLTEYVDSRVTDLITNIAAETQSAKSIALDASDAVTQFVTSYNNYYIPQLNSSINSIETGFANFTNAINTSFAALDSSLTAYAHALDTSLTAYTNRLDTSFASLQTNVNNSLQTMRNEINTFEQSTNQTVTTLTNAFNVNSSLLEEIRADFNTFDLVTARGLAQLDASVIQLFEIIGRLS